MSEESLKGKISVGDEVIISRSQINRNRQVEHTYTTATITRIGRKLAYISEHNYEVGFYLDTGVERSHYPRRMFTEQTLAAHAKRRQLLIDVQTYTDKYGWVRELSTDALEKILAILSDPKSHEEHHDD